MNTVPEMELDLEKLFLPAWAQESASPNRYEHHAGGDGERSDRKRDFQPGRRPQRRDQQGPGPNRGARPRDGQRPHGKDGRRPMRGDNFQRREPFQAPPPLPEVNATVLPDDNGVESLARQIKTTGRAYPLFGIAQIVLQKPERFAVKFSVKKTGDGQVAQPLFVCALDDSLWLSEDEVVAHVLKIHFATFYQAERTAVEPPKGTYTFVAQCGMSGVILGPPNHHDYQNQLRKLHAERFSNMPFEAFKARVKIVRDEAVVKKWVEDQSWTTQYICLNVPEPLTLPNMDEVEKHFRAVHKEAIVKPVQEHTLSGVAARGMRCNGLVRLARQVVEDQRHFPLQIATTLSQRFGTFGLHFFKVNKTFTHVSVARPSFLDLETTPVSDGIKRIVEFINSKPKCSRRQLVEALAPTPTVIEIQPVAQTDTEAGTQTDSGNAKPPKGGTPNSEPTPEQTAVVADLHWLIHQGHVIEFADGRLDTAKKPAPKPPKAQPKVVESAQQTPAPEAAAPAVAVEESAATATAVEQTPGAEVVAPVPAVEESTVTEVAVEQPAAPTEKQPPPVLNGEGTTVSDATETASAPSGAQV